MNIVHAHRHTNRVCCEAILSGCVTGLIESKEGRVNICIISVWGFHLTLRLVA
jgi:hypothetical protein